MAVWRHHVVFSGYGSINQNMAFYFFRIWRISLGNGTMWLITLKSDGSGCANNRLNSSNPAIGNEMNRALGHLCAHKNRARRRSWGWWDDCDDTVLQTQDSKLKPWRSEAEHATSRSRRVPTILTFTRGWGRNIFFFEPPRPGTEPRTLAWKTAVLTTTLGPPPTL